MADAAVAKGLREVSGDIVADDSYFPYDPYPAGWTTGDLFFEFGAPVGALTLNDNILAIQARPGARPGEPGTIAVEPEGAMGTFDCEVTTTAPGGKSEFAVVHEAGPNFMLLRANITVGHAPMTIELAMPQPAETAARELKTLLEARGVRITGGTRVVHGAPPQTPAAGEPILTGTSQPPSEFAGRFLLAEHLSPALIEERAPDQQNQPEPARGTFFAHRRTAKPLGLGVDRRGIKSRAQPF